MSGGTTSGGSAFIGDTAGSTTSLFRVMSSGVASESSLQLDATGSIEVRSGGTLALNTTTTDASSTIFLSDPAPGASALTVGNVSGSHSATFRGVIADAIGSPGGITCVGSGQNVFHGMNTYTGPTKVSTGLLAGNGRIAGPLSLTSGAQISPGNFITTPPGTTDAGCLQVGPLTMAQGTTYTAQLNGPAAGQYDVLGVSGAVDLSAGPTLVVELGYNATAGQTFTIFNVGGGTSNPIIGQFANAPNGSVFVSNGHAYAVNYSGGEGNDLVLQLLDPVVTSRKLHGNGAPYDIPLSLVEPAAIECRTGGGLSLVLTFDDPLVSVGGVSITAGVETVASHGFGSEPRQYLVNLTGVNNLQRVTVRLTNVTDSAGHMIPAVSATLRVLAGDTNGDGTVNAADAQQTRARAGIEVDATNFRSDVNLDGFINSGDALAVRSRAGNSVP